MGDLAEGDRAQPLEAQARPGDGEARDLDLGLAVRAEVELEDARRELRDRGGLLSEQAEQIETQAPGTFAGRQCGSRGPLPSFAWTL